ncbi:Sec-independent protein translocase protein TatB [Rhizobium sp. SL42]|uniref:Sec-independent protein translocase protein TatB n=1 Tax=Rhizobium sp. SL42 TaxID=2806346 RepID=UPI001F027CD6|nr:Sec-independent protein translocase protein TatB [Rhizobium sp. SL42]UJW73504.1 twin-arginine translocase subunit TatB [Rhizobium sp. SL42]
MLDIGWTELLVIAVVLIVVVGPKDLPPMIRAFGKMTKRLRQTAGEFRSQFDEALREAELDDLKKSVDDLRSLNPTNSLRDAINPLRQMGQDIKSDLQKASRVDTPSVSEKPAAVSHPAAASDVASAPVVEHSILPDLIAPTAPPADLAASTPPAAAAPATSSPAGIDQPVKKTASRKTASTTTAPATSATAVKSPKAKPAAKTAGKVAEPKVAAPKSGGSELAGPKTAEPVAAVTQAGTVAAPAAPRKPRKTKSEDRA